MDPDDLDGCELDFAPFAVSDSDIDGLVLFADVDPFDLNAVEARKAEWEALSGA